MSYILRDYQQAAVDAGVAYLTDERLKGRHGIVVAPTGCHAAGTKILMFDGSVKAIEDVVVNDIVMGPDSTSRRVLGLCRGMSQMYRIAPRRGGQPFVVNDDHVLALTNTPEGRIKPKRPHSKRRGEHSYVRVRDYVVKAKSWRHMWKLERAGVVRFRHPGELPLPPWVLGALLGDGFMKNGGVSICTADMEIRREIERFARGWWLRIRVATKPLNKAVDLYLTKRDPVRDRRYPSTLMVALRQLGLYGTTAATKFVPAQYKTASEAARLELLAGLLDTDGSHDGCGGFDFSVKSNHLAVDVAFVARSLGFAVSETERKHRNGNTYYRITISGDTNRIPCRVGRKRAPARRQKKNWRITGFSVEPAGIGDYFGFTLDGDHLYLTSDFTIHHNSGKSLVIANIIARLPGPCVVLQPSKEILEQNASKLASYGYRAAIFSASFGRREIGRITLATIGSVVRHAEAFRDIPYVLIDECHAAVNPKGGMYTDFLAVLLEARILGLTATPFRLASNSLGSELRFLTRTRPRIFRDVVHVTQIEELRRGGYWAPLDYRTRIKVQREKLQLNSSGADYTDVSVQRHFAEIGFVGALVDEVRTLLTEGRKHILVFTRFVHESERLAQALPCVGVVTAETPASVRDQIVREFRAGRLRVVTNVGCLALGFDFPALDAVVLGRPSISLSVFYQQVGRSVRPHPSKANAAIVDMVGLVPQFGQVEDLVVRPSGPKGEQWVVTSNGRALTNIYFAQRDGVDQQVMAQAQQRRQYWARRRGRT